MSSQPLSPETVAAPQPPWYGLRTKSNQERMAVTMLAARGFEPYLPSYSVRRRWSDRVVETTLPLFSGYVFCRFDSSQKLPIVRTPGVVSVVSFGNLPAPIDEAEIEAIRTLLQSGAPVLPHPYLREGQRVRVRDGVLQGVEGILIQIKSEWRMIISITLLQRSIAVEVDRDCLDVA